VDEFRRYVHEQRREAECPYAARDCADSWDWSQNALTAVHQGESLIEVLADLRLEERAVARFDRGDRCARYRGCTSQH
jgi:hypothetical protein